MKWVANSPARLVGDAPTVEAVGSLDEEQTETLFGKRNPTAICPKIQEQCYQALRVRAHSQSHSLGDPRLQNDQPCCVRVGAVRENIRASRRPYGSVLLPRPRAMGAAEVFWGRHGVRHRGQGSWSQPSLRVPIERTWQPLTGSWCCLE